MTLFSMLPPQLFSPLASPGAALYAEVLLTIFGETRRHQQPLSRELALSLVRELLVAAEDGLAATHDAEDEPATPDDDDPLSRRAAAVVRYLTRCGWLRIETQSDFTQTFTLPDYAFRLLNVLHEIATDEPLPIQGLIFSIYSLLQTSVREGNAHISLPEAYRQTTSLMSGLKELQHNIGVHIEQVLRQLQARDVLAQIFLHYRGEIMDKAYHQLRTTDHVSRFRPGVIEALALLSNEQQVVQIAQSLRASGFAPTVEAAASRLLEQIREIRSQFELLDRLLQAIDLRHSQFVDSAVRTIELQLTASSTTSGQLHALLGHLLTADDGALEAAVTEHVELFSLALLEAESLAAPTRAAVPFVAETRTLPQLSAEDVAAAQAQTLQQLRRSVSRERIRHYAAQLLGEADMVHVGTQPLDHPDNLAMLIYLRQYGDGSLGYRSEDTPEGTWIERDGIGFRDFVIRRL
ncbi:Wadjet anti-phage system protein JetA family protein [Candidatus Viridilinea mediisalina]|uniref:Uncharacterized protein n=1 Tax=Candidatus Viridilinea mediisalina TaxID=2024553 RepID=A0A2A6RKB8_9CHLR|nr:Wadjet anti-phage system protein JetA family protein [Candidatus Viridilinea mediisalina]PDW03329.1 hypothetical protein CJ255_09450 [Candidatus Viridilinea mediisalina]